MCSRIVEQQAILDGFMAKHTPEYIAKLVLVMKCNLKLDTPWGTTYDRFCHAKVCVCHFAALIGDFSLQMNVPCLYCGKYMANPMNVHFDHVEDSTKQFHVGSLITPTCGMANKPSADAYVRSYAGPKFDTGAHARAHTRTHARTRSRTHTHAHADP